MMQHESRYSRHELLKGFGAKGQEKIRNSSVLIIGAGGLGSTASLYLASSGVGRLTIVDGDSVDLTNLQRQILHSTERIGVPKALSAKISLQAINPEVRVIGLMTVPNRDLLTKLVQNHDYVLDCTDNTESRYLLNEVCREQKKILVTAGCVGYSGQVTVFDFSNPNSACYACLFPNHDGADEKASSKGVFAPMVGMLGCIQASETLKLMAGIGESLINSLFMIDVSTMQIQKIRYKKNGHCPVCGKKEEDHEN